MKEKSLNCKTFLSDEFKLSNFTGYIIVALNTYVHKDISKTTILFRR